MHSRIPALLLALSCGITSGALFAQDEGESAPSVLDAEPVADAETPADEASLDVVPAEDEPPATVIQESGDVLSMPETTAEPASPVVLPHHGMKMDEVERRFGTPLSREPAVGQPPISRWNYADFSVFFEHRTVLHAVQKDRPAQIYRKDELLPASTP